MARGFLYVYERIYKGETEMQTEFRKIPVNGKRTSVADQKRVRKIISDNAHRIAQECSVLVSYPKMRIEGTAVNLGDVHITVSYTHLDVYKRQQAWNSSKRTIRKSSLRMES